MSFYTIFIARYNRYYKSPVLLSLGRLASRSHPHLAGGSAAPAEPRLALGAGAGADRAGPRERGQPHAPCRLEEAVHAAAVGEAALQPAEVRVEGLADVLALADDVLGPELGQVGLVDHEEDEAPVVAALVHVLEEEPGHRHGRPTPGSGLPAQVDALLVRVVVAEAEDAEAARPDLQLRQSLAGCLRTKLRRAFFKFRWIFQE